LTDAYAVLIASGKGGVGKSLIAINMAHKLMEKGKKVGLLDSDFSSKSIRDFINLPPGMMDVSGERFHPIDVDGLKLWSMSLFVGVKPVSMEGSMYSELLNDAVKASEWGDVDYIVVDAPPGWSDTFKRTIEVFSNFLGCLIVSQPAHVTDLRSGVDLCKDLEVRIIGIIENMSYLKVGDGQLKIFGESKIEELGKDFNVDIFGRIPLCMEIRDLVASKKPFLTGELAGPIEKAADKILTLKPEKPGFLAKAGEWIREKIVKALTGIVLAINDEIDITGVQKQFAYPGGSVVQLNIMREDMRTVISHWNFMVSEGKLLAVESEPNKPVDPDYRIDIWKDGLKWALLRNRQLSDGSTYDFESALRMGHMKLYGPLAMVRGARFLREVLRRLSENEKAINRIRPLLEVL